MRNRIRLFSAVIAAAALLATQAQAAQAQVNMSGTWALEADVDGAISNPGLVLVQSGMSLTGRYTSAQLGDACRR